jgi:hypothetical protein
MHGKNLADAQIWRRSLASYQIPRTAAVPQGQGNELVVTVARSWRLRGGYKTREDIASHDQAFFIVERVKFLHGIDRLGMGQTI